MNCKYSNTELPWRRIHDALHYSSLILIVSVIYEKQYNLLLKLYSLGFMAEAEFETESSVHGYHVYQDNWTPVIGEPLHCEW